MEIFFYFKGAHEIWIKKKQKMNPDREMSKNVILIFSIVCKTFI